MAIVINNSIRNLIVATLNSVLDSIPNGAGSKDFWVREIQMIQKTDYTGKLSNLCGNPRAYLVVPLSNWFGYNEGICKKRTGRTLEQVKSAFNQGVRLGYTTDNHWRKLLKADGTLNDLVTTGDFFSSARADSQYGTASERRQGASIAGSVKAGFVPNEKQVNGIDLQGMLSAAKLWAAGMAETLTENKKDVNKDRIVLKSGLVIDLSTAGAGKPVLVPKELVGKYPNDKYLFISVAECENRRWKALETVGNRCIVKKPQVLAAGLAARPRRRLAQR